MRRRTRLRASLPFWALVLVGCQGLPNARLHSTRTATASPAPASPVVVPIKVAAASPTPTAGASALPTPPVGAALVGRVLAPPALIANNGGNVISNNGGGLVTDHGTGRRLLGLDQVPYAGAVVGLYTATGTPVTGADGRPITAVTDAAGNYRLPFAGNADNLVIGATLPASRGSLQAFVPKGAPVAAASLDLDLVSTLTTGYILDRFVRPQADPTATFDKLPPDVEADTRRKAAAALAGGDAAVPSALTAAAVDAAVEDLRRQDAAVDGQLRYVESLLLAGLSNQGIGLPATTVQIDAQAVAVGPGGRLAIAGLVGARIWTVDDQGRLQVLAGNGDTTEIYSGSPPPTAPGDGAAATLAPLRPTDLAYDAAGDLYLTDFDHHSVRRIDPQGRITTVNLQTDAIQNPKLATLPDGTLLEASRGVVWRMTQGGPVLVTGAERAAGTGNGDGGPAASASLDATHALAVDPRSGDLYIYDEARVRRVRAGTIETVAGTGKAGFSGDAGPATSATIGAAGALAVDFDGSLLIADTYNFRVRRVSNGTIQTIAGDGTVGVEGDGGPALQAHFTAALRALAVDSAGTIHVVDGGRVRAIAGTTITAEAGKAYDITAPQTADQANLNPFRLAFDPTANALLIGEPEAIRRLRLDTNIVETIAGGRLALDPLRDGMGALEAHFGGAGAMLLAPDGTLALLYRDVNQVTRLIELRDGKLHLVAGAPPDPNGGLAQFAAEGPALSRSLWIGSVLARVGDTYYIGSGPRFDTPPDAAGEPVTIRRLGPDGNLVHFAGGGTSTADGTPAAQYKFDGLYALAKDPMGNAIFASELWAIDRIDLDTGLVTRWAGTGQGGTLIDSGPATSGPVEGTDQFAFDAKGNIYIAASDTGQVRRIDRSTHAISPVAGNGSPNLAGATVDDSLSGPAGLAFDAEGNLYIADADHHQIKKVPADRL